MNNTGQVMGAHIAGRTEPARATTTSNSAMSASRLTTAVVLDDVSFFVDRGETCVILGRSGVGKSVTLKHVMGFLRPDSGRVFVDGQDITDWTEEQLVEIRRRVTMVFQSGALV